LLPDGGRVLVAGDVAEDVRAAGFDVELVAPEQLTGLTEPSVPVVWLADRVALHERWRDPRELARALAVAGYELGRLDDGTLCAVDWRWLSVRPHVTYVAAASLPARAPAAAPAAEVSEVAASATVPERRALGRALADAPRELLADPGVQAVLERLRADEDALVRSAAAWSGTASPDDLERTRRLVDDFHRLFYHAGDTAFGTWMTTRWLGVPIYKSPFDLWVYQELVARLRPEVIVETGTLDGGSALFLAHLCDLLGRGRVVTIDIQDAPGPGWLADLEQPRRVPHQRVEYVLGSSTDEAVVERVRGAIGEDERVLVILDSDHRAPHVARELELWSPLVAPGSYVIDEDGNVNGHPVHPGYGPGPQEAIEGFLASRAGAQFDVDRSCERLLMTFNPRGYLRRRVPGESHAEVPDPLARAALAVPPAAAAADPDELSEARATAARLERELAALQATRLWQVGSRWWSVRDRLRRTVRRS
jgi:cephalosporin hydroxylase